MTRTDIRTIVVFAGDRNYMPIDLRVRERGKKLHFVVFEASLSGELKKLVGKSNYSYVVSEIKTETAKDSIVKSEAYTQTVVKQNEI